MSEICIQVPQMDEHKFIEVEVKVNGEKKRYNYRVELFDWNGQFSDAEDRIQRMRAMIDNYDSNWQLFQIGAPTEKHIPIMFRQKI
ncbi:MAG: hypothetical protein GWN16_11175 [Calditrichae bacterium]|nr:hypothetical protein [Calditrichia bacterium]NIW79976.1 hypothetical protein [Calditrichia bacterium]